MPNIQIPSRSSSLQTGQANQSGVSLIIVLIFLVAMTVAGVYSVRLSIFGEASSRNALDQQAARQAAEAALRDAERDILLAEGEVSATALCSRTDGGVAERPIKEKVGLFNALCTRGQCFFEKSYYAAANYRTGTSPEPWWPTGKGGLWNDTFSDKPSPAAGKGTNCSFNGAVPYSTFTGAKPLVGVIRQPEYLIEVLDPTFPNAVRYRITARGFGYSPNAQVVLQSYFQIKN